MSDSVEKELTRAIVERVLALGSDIDPQRVAPIVAAVLHEELDQSGSGSGCRNPLRCEWAIESQTSGQRAIVTTTGRNHPGVMAAISNTIAEAGCDIQDVSQTIVCEFFTMIMVVDIDKLTGTFDQFKQRVQQVAQELGVELSCVHEDILNAMHRV